MSQTVRFQALDTGYCVVRERLVLRGGAWRKIHCHALAFLIEHPREGWILFDTGYAPRMIDATARFPFRLYRWATPLRLDPQWALVEQLPLRGIPVHNVRWIILSHLHADHVAGLLDFPQSRIVVTQAAADDLDGRAGWRALKRAYLPALFPTDLKARSQLVTTFDDEPLPHLGKTHDLFGDGLMRLVPLPGHARGQVGLWLSAGDGPVLLAADGCWHSRAFREGRPPHPLTHFIIDDRAAMLATLQSLTAFSRACPGTRILPTHCPEVWSQYTPSGKAAC